MFNTTTRRDKSRSQPSLGRSIVQKDSMHELSIASSIVETVSESAAAYPGARVKEVRLRVGALASIVEDSLQFCWELATEDSPLAGSKLVIHRLPVIVHCESCGIDSELDGVQSFRCPRCGEIAADLRQGRELEIESIELEDPDPAPDEPAKIKEQV
ncbi:MAG: hydrogenase maturation nickel metallochaperone HypA [Terracidiphilus sp.]|jgi:hydrogenase nickel incorporation protein HypA/HybF